MKEIIQEKLLDLPEKPGVYRMLDAKGNIIYIGKSKCLKDRVSSYFVPNPVWEKARKMAPFIVDIRYTVTPTHLEAMLLECHLIKEIKPYFNSMMKNDKRYVYLEIREDRRKSPLGVTYIKEENCFGPFRSKNRTEEIARALEYLYPIEKSRGKYRFEYHILPVEMEEETFVRNRKILLELFEKPGAMGLMASESEKKMQQAARAQKYELAGKYRDYVQIFSYLDRTLHMHRELLTQELVYTVPIEAGCRLFYIREGLVMARKTVEKPGPQELECFLREAKQQGIGIENTESEESETVNTAFWDGLSDKEKMDYRTILYWELAEAEKDRIFPV